MSRSYSRRELAERKVRAQDHAVLARIRAAQRWADPQIVCVHDDGVPQGAPTAMALAFASARKEAK